MNKRLLLWLAPAVAYAAVALWYTNLGGKLSDEEVEAFAAQLAAGGVEPEGVATLRRFMASDDGRSFFMVNLTAQRETPAPGGPVPGQAMERYMEYMLPQMLRRASHPAFVGPARFQAMDLFGIEGADGWDQAALVRYRSRRDIMEIVANPEMRERHPYKIAALQKTIAFPVSPTIYFGDLRLLLALAVLAATALADMALYRRRAR